MNCLYVQYTVRSYRKNIWYTMKPSVIPKFLRAFSATPSFHAVAPSLSTTSSSPSEEKTGIFGGFFQPRPIEKQQSTHGSKLSSAREDIVELQIHVVRPGAGDDYVDAHRKLAEHVRANRDAFHCESLGNFVVLVGEQDQRLHLWRYDDGYQGADASMRRQQDDAEYRALEKGMAECLQSRRNQYLMPFGFWPEVQLREEGKNLYELRSYMLKPGTMVEWGNYWAKAVKMRVHMNKEAYIGLFSQARQLEPVVQTSR